MEETERVLAGLTYGQADRRTDTDFALSTNHKSPECPTKYTQTSPVTIFDDGASFEAISSAPMAEKFFKQKIIFLMKR